MVESPLIVLCLFHVLLSNNHITLCCKEDVYLKEHICCATKLLFFLSAAHLQELLKNKIPFGGYYPRHDHIYFVLRIENNVLANFNGMIRTSYFY